MISKIKADLKKVSSKKRKETNEWFFKTGKGEYGEGDKFIGVSLPDIRKIAKKYSEASLKEIESLLKSPIHEERLLSLIMLVLKYKKTKDKKYVDFYLKNTKRVNNWDLVDTSASYILGNWLLDKNRKILYKLAKSKNLWEKRIGIISTWEFIRNEEVEDTIKISDILMKDEHDLIHKAVGWMLREAHKKKPKKLEVYVKKNKLKMPRTMLRYAIERYPKKLKEEMMKK